MNEELKKQLEALTADLKYRNDELKKVLEERSDANDKIVTELKKDIADLQKRIDDVAVNANRPTGVEGALRKSTELGKILRSAEFAEVNIVNRADAPASTTTTHSNIIIPEFLKEIIRQEDAITQVRSIFSWQTVNNPDIRQFIGEGMKASHVGETDTRDTTVGTKFTEIQPTWSQIFTQPEISNNLLQDATYDIEGWYQSEVARAHAVAIEEDILQGDGTSNACKGLFKLDMVEDADGVRDVAKYQKLKITSETAVTYENLIDLIGSLRTAYRTNASFYVNHSLWLQLKKLTDANKRPLLEPNVTLGAPSKLLGYPVYESEFVPSVAAGSIPLAFGDFKRAATGFDRPDVTVIRDNITHKGFTKFYTERRFGFMMKDTAAIKFLEMGGTASA